MSSWMLTDALWQKAVSDIAEMRKEFPKASEARLARQVIKSACLRAGATGAGSTAVGLIPGFGRVLKWAATLVGDAAMTASIQREMALKLFTLQNRKPDEADVQYLSTLLGTVGVGGIELVEQIGGGMLKSIATRMLGKILRRGLPVAEVVGSSATHVVGTYLLAGKIQRYLQDRQTRAEIVIDEPDARRLRKWTMLSLGTVVDDENPKTVKDAFRQD